MSKKAILSSAALLFAVVASFAFKSNSNGRFGQGTLFTKSGSPAVCHPVNCKRIDGTAFCALQTYYTTNTCPAGKGLRITPTSVGS